MVAQVNLERRGLAWLFVAALAFLGLFAHGYVENGDAEVTMHAAVAWAHRGDPGLRRAAVDSTVPERFIAEQIQGTKRWGIVGRDGAAYVWFPIGHQALMVPAVWLGDQLARLAPTPERRLVELKGEAYGLYFWTRFLLSLLPILCAAGTTVVLFCLARCLGLDGRGALLVTAVATLCTAFWPGSSETMSDGPGTFLLLAAVLGVFRYREAVARARPGARHLALAGLLAGGAVLVRYPHAVPVLIASLAAAFVAWRARRLRDLLALVAGGAPAVAALLAANWWRFGSWFETGYSAGANPQWWSYAPYLGIPLILLAPGKGILLFSPPLWPALGAVLRRRNWQDAWPWFVALPCFALPIVISGHTAGWAGGQCWSVRYVTPGVLLVVVVGLSFGQPWRRWPKAFALCCALGFAISVGGVLTPYRGDRQLAYSAAASLYPEVAQTNAALLPMYYDFDWRLSPLRSHWVYAWLSATGRLEQGGAANTTLPMFGVDVPGEAGAALRPGQLEDVRFRHWWWRYGVDLLGWSAWPAAVLAALALLSGCAAVRRLRALPSFTA
jgi:hypothetical protein